jgi:hypothetical protein
LEAVGADRGSQLGMEHFESDEAVVLLVTGAIDGVMSPLSCCRSIR